MYLIKTNHSFINIKHFIVIIILCILLVDLVSASESSNSQQTKDPIILDGFGCSVKIKLIPDKPSVGDNVKIIFYLESPYKKIPEYHVTFQLLKGAELINGNLIQTWPSLKKGGISSSFIIARVVSPHFVVFINAHAHLTDPYSRYEWGVHLGGKMIDALYFKEGDDLSYEKYGNDSEIWPRIGPEYLYDIVEGTRMPSVGHVTKEAQEIRNEIERLQLLDPTLTDWEALELIHDAIYEMIVRYGIQKKEESIPILLQARNLMKKEGISKWEAVDKIITKKLKKIDTLNMNQKIIDKTKLVDITISGTLKYKKHCYNKTNGLDTITIDMPLRDAKVWLRGYWWGHGAEFFGPTSTDNLGYFEWTIQNVTVFCFSVHWTNCI